MTAVSTTYDRLETIIEAELPDYKKLANPYDIETNADIFLKKSYALAYGPGANTNRLVGCKSTFLREYRIILNNEIDTTEHNLSARENIEKNLMEDVNKLFLAIEDDSDLNGTAVRSIFVSDGGPEILEGDRSRYLSVEMSAEVEFFQS